MKKPAKSNMYSYSSDAAWALYAAFLDGAQNAPVFVLSERPATASVVNAMTKSFEKLGYGENPCLFASTVAAESEDARLDAAALLSLTESLDPRIVISCDESSTRLVSAAYRLDLPSEGAARIWGRNAVIFADFENMLTSSDSKQRAWALLKSLPAGSLF